MKLGVFNPIFDGMPLEEMLGRLVAWGLEAVEMRSGPNSGREIQAGRYPCQEQCDPAVLLADKGKLGEFRAAFARYGLSISGLSCHGNPVHPDREQAEIYHRSFENSVRLASELEVPCVVVFSGTPGGSPQDRTPNWVIAAWPTDYADMLRYQWEDVLIPYWQQASQFAQQHGVKIAVEPHPGFSVYNTTTGLRLREAVGPNLGINFDPSHLFWQGIDPPAAIKALKGAIFHLHAKDTYIDPQNKAVKGVLDSSSYRDLAERTWVFRSVGYGHDAHMWKRIVSALRMSGYDGVVSIEHEDALASRDEGLSKAIACLRECLLSEKPAAAFWA